MQINLSIPKEWKVELERIARLQSVEQDKTITYSDLIRQSIVKEYKIDEENKHRGTNR